jgi:phage FluMu protein Com
MESVSKTKFVRAVFCRYCRKRLFDAEEGDEARIHTVCPKCGEKLDLEIADKYLTEEIRMNPFKPIAGLRPP